MQQLLNGGLVGIIPSTVWWWWLAGALTHLGINCTVEGDARAMPSCE
jgi:hypothetical protein